MLAGSSCTQTISRASGWRANSAASSASGKGIELLQENNSGGSVFSLLALRPQFVADLAGAQHNPFGVVSFLVRQTLLETDDAVKSASGDAASGCRSMLFGVKTTSGLRHLRNACRRNR